MNSEYLIKCQTMRVKNGIHLKFTRPFIYVNTKDHYNLKAILLKKKLTE